ncbi:hypothetical protein [Streptomyces violaceorubidus]|uniref:hypothetical protein n=1 Tax=Streptomyces violaceorubidus TaxID=284042 RepID=UPI0031593D78
MTGRREAAGELRARLREAAGRTGPTGPGCRPGWKRGRTAGTGGPARPRLPGRVWVAAATAAVAGVLVAGGYTPASAVRDDGPAPRPVAAPPGSPEPGPAAVERRGGPAQQRVLAEQPHPDDACPLTALTVELRVAQTGSVTSTGA